MRALTVLLCLSGVAQAQTTIDFYQGPIIGSGRVVGLGGAYIGIAEGADGHLVNPAAFTVRYLYTQGSHYDWDVTFSILNVPDRQIDLDQSGALTKAGTSLGQLGGNFKWGQHGIGVHSSTQTHDLQSAQYQQTYGGLGYAYAMGSGEWVFGGVLTAGTAELDINDSSSGLNGGGLLLGALWKPIDQRYRVGFVFRSGVLGNEEENVSDEARKILPDALSIPWEIGVGGSYMLGQRQYNFRPTYGRAGREPPSSAGREYVLLAADLVLTGPTQDGVGIRGFLEENPRSAGEQLSFSMRVGAESEIITDRLVVRGGSYYEPSRYAAFSGRFHATAGLDMHVSMIWEWRLGLVVDVANDYLNWGLGLGFWH